MVGALDVAGHPVGPGYPCFIIAEAGVNHNGSLAMALELVEAAAASGADAVKFQTFRAGEIASTQAPLAEYQQRTGGGGQLEMLASLELSADDHRALKEHCARLGIIFLSTAFDAQSVDLLLGLGVAALKIPSGEITNLPLLRHIGTKGRPVILSTGMSSLEEVNTALETLRGEGCAHIAVLHCVSNYPARAEDVNLRAMLTLKEAFGLPVGYSDHTLGLEVPLAAAALGACVLEKHFTLDKSLPGPDHVASATSGELACLVLGVRRVEAALGHGRKEPIPSEAPIKSLVRRSLVAARDIPAGTVLGPEHIELKRPGTGFGPDRLQEVLGKRAATDIPADSLISAEMLA